MIILENTYLYTFPSWQSILLSYFLCHLVLNGQSFWTFLQLHLIMPFSQTILHQQLRLPVRRQGRLPLLRQPPVEVDVVLTLQVPWHWLLWPHFSLHFQLGLPLRLYYKGCSLTYRILFINAYYHFGFLTCKLSPSTTGLLLWCLKCNLFTWLQDGQFSFLPLLIGVLSYLPGLDIVLWNCSI